MRLGIKSFIRLCLVVAIMPIMQVHADYYNSALGPTYRTTPIKMQDATDAQKAGAIVTSVKSQGDTGTCWSFSLNAAVETSLMKQMEKAGLTPAKDNFDFSERYTAWMMYALSTAEEKNKTNHPFYDPGKALSTTELANFIGKDPKNIEPFRKLSQGGTIFNEVSALMGNFLVEEKTRPEMTQIPNLQFYGSRYDALQNKIVAPVTPTYKARDVYFDANSTSRMGVDSAGQLSQLQKYKDLLKNTTGSLRVDYYVGEGDTTSGPNIYNSVVPKDAKGEVLQADHAILVVGYDDDYDFSNSSLTYKPPGKGAWIVKNSWGTGVGDAGFYYISYYDKTAAFSSGIVVEPDIARYTVTDTHTPFYMGQSLSPNDPAAKAAYIPSFASTYKPKDNQFLKAVSFITNSDGASYTIDVIKNSKNPGSKPIYTQTGTFSGSAAMAGYHTVDLDKFFLLPKTEDYVIRVTVKGNNGGLESVNTLGLRDDIKTYNLTFANGRSYYAEGTGWTDANKEQKCAVILNGQSKETTSANGGDFTVGSLSCTNNSGVVINLGSATALYGTDILNPSRKTLSNMTVDNSADDDFWGTITGQGGVTKTGTGELSFYKDNTYTGITNVNQGVLSNYSSIASNVDVKSGAFYRILNGINETINQRGISNEGNVFIAAVRPGIIKFANTTDVLQGSAAGTWYLNAKDLPTLSNKTNGTIIIGANTDGVLGNVYLEGGTIKLTADQTNFFINALKHENGAKINLKNQIAPARMGIMSFGAPSSTPLSEVNLGRMVIAGTSEIDIDATLEQSELKTDLIKGTVVQSDGTTEDNTPNKIKLGFTLDKDVIFDDDINGVSSTVAQGQIGNGINNSAFIIDRGEATGSYNITYSYDGGAKEGTLQIINEDSPTSLQDAITANVTSKYYAVAADQVLTGGWNANLVGNDLTLVGNNTTVDGDKKTQIFNVSNDQMLTINDLSVKQGIGTAIHNEGSLSLNSINKDVKVTQNDGVDGGAIYNQDVLTLSTLGNNIKFQDNTATNGAGVYNNDTGSENNVPTVYAVAGVGDVVFDNNTASTNGGAVYNKGDVILSADGGNIQLTNNKAQSGAGIYNTGSVSVYTADKTVDFNKNIASANGGAVLNNGGNVSVINQGGNVNFSQNEAVSGGAIYNTKPGGATDPAVVNLVAEKGNITFDGNKASANGGAIYNTETVNILALENQNVAFKQSTDSIYNTGIINFNHNADYGITNGLISTGAELGGTGTYNLYSGELAFVKSSNNPASHGSISNDATLSVINDSILNLANGIKETFKPGTLQIANSTALYVAIDCILNGNASAGDFLDAGTYTGGTKSQIIIAAVNLINENNETQTSYRIKIAGITLESAISQNLLAEIAGYRSAYSPTTGDLLLLSTSVKGLVDYVESTDNTRTYSMAQDELAIFPLGIMGGENSTLTINGNNNKIVSEFADITGITVSATNTLNANNVSFDNFETAIINKGTLNLNNVIFHGQANPALYDVNNSSTMTATNTVSGKVLNSGMFVAGTTNDLSNLSIRSIGSSILDLRNTTNDINLKGLSIAGNVDLYINGVNKLSATTVSRDAGTDSLIIKAVSEMKALSTTVTDTVALQPYIKIADDAYFTLADAAKPVGAYNAYKLAYAAGNISVNGVDLSDSSTKSGSINVANSANFVASAGNTIDTGTGVTLNGPSTGVQVNITNDTLVTGTFGLNRLTSNGQKIIVDHFTTSSLKVTDSTVNNELELNGGTTEVKNSLLNGGINMAAASALSFASGVNTVNGAITGANGASLAINAPTVFNGEVDPVSETVNSLAIHNANVSQVDFSINDGGILTFTKDSYLNNDNTNKVNFNGGSMNLINGVASTITLSELSFTPATSGPITSNLYVDVDLANKTMDKLVGTTMNVGTGSVLNVAAMRLLSDAKTDSTIINFTQDANLKGIVMTSLSSVAYSPIYKYLVDYNNSTGDFGFTRSLNPAILSSSVAAQVGSYLTQINSYEQAFGNMDMMMSMTTEQRQAMKLANKFADAGSGANLTTFSPNQIPEQEKGVWYRPYATFENVGLNNGPTVGNVAYGSLFGGDSPIIELKNGWDAVFTGYAGYNGSHQTYDGVGIYQSGATLGATGVFYKGNLFTGLTANVGANVAEANTMFGKEDFTMLTSGIASKTGYNWELNGGKFIIQPNYLMSYSFVNTFNYTNAAGVEMTSSPLNAIQISPGIRFIGNLKNGWQPYAVVQMVWNIMDQTKFSANDVSLPELSVKPYIQYGIGLQRRWGERFTGYGQAMIRNGGRNGIALQFGFRWALGKAPQKMTKSSKDGLRCQKTEPKKCNINLQSFKSDEQLGKKSLLTTR